jgi:D-alanyl-lipoteichoic acid acyltransferase DltB (MBOAT superfamily)
MLFNSFQYLLFLPFVFILYWVLKRYIVQNAFLLVVSYFFYGCWDWRFLFLLIFSTFLDYYTGLKISESVSKKNRKSWLLISVVVNLGFLSFFKYFNFFSHSFSLLLSNVGLQVNEASLNIILPVGISFYTFHGLSYVFDIYYGKIKPTHNYINYSLFVSYFPLLVAGPIERANHLLPQLEKPRAFNYSLAVDGLKQILWGFFKKIVIADNCAEYANLIFNNSEQYSGSVLVLGAVFFTFQIYGDFSGYSDIALGSSKLLGIQLLKNFSFPYFSRDMAEFWRRWHISLSSWFKEYLYIPLGGSKVGLVKKIRNTFIIFLVSGFWHGANWTFLIWGFLNALFIVPSIIFNTNRNNIEIVAKGKWVPTIKELLNLIITFSLTVFAWIFFRAESVEHAFSYISHMISASLFSNPLTSLPELKKSALIMVLIAFFMVVEWLGREGNYGLETIFKKSTRFARWSFYSFILFLIGMYMQTTETGFIYFQF